MILLLHAVLGLAAVVAGSLQAAWAVLAARGKPLPRLRPWIAPAVVAAQFILGLALYPAYRVQVRVDLERTAPALVQLFDFKEHLAALSLALILGAAFASRDTAAEARWPAAAMSFAGAAFLWLAAVVGVVVTARHSV